MSLFIPIITKIKKYLKIFKLFLKDPNKIISQYLKAGEELAVYKNAYFTTMEDRDRLSAIMRDVTDVSEAYKHAYFTTLADRDRLSAAVRDVTDVSEVYKHAYFTTLADRDRLSAAMRDVSDVLDAGHFRFDFFRFKEHKIKNEADQLFMQTQASIWDKLFKDGKFSELINDLISRVNVRVAHPNSQDYFQRYAVYYMACFFAAIRDSEKTLYYTSKIEFDAPADGTDFLPYAIQQASRLIFYRQNIAIDKGLPGVLIIALPKSASAFLSNSLAAIMDVPIIRITVGEGFESYPVARWIRQFVRGGAVTHEHMEGSDDNINILQAAGIKNLWIQVRDPRDAAYSLLKSAQRESFNFNLENDSLEFVRLSLLFSVWIEQWLLAASSEKFNIRVQFINYQQITKDFSNIVKTILAEKMTQTIEQSMEKYLEEFDRSSVPNFRKGTGDEWRTAFDPEIQQEVWQNIPDSVKELLGLKP